MAFYNRFRLATLVACAIALGGCTSDFAERGGLRSAMGLTSNAPDEFLVVSKAPLVMPPDVHLRPPRPGTAPAGQQDPRSLARSSVTGSVAPAVPQGASAGEQAILARANASQADPNVREQLLREEGAAMADQKVLDRILGRTPGADTIDPYDEAERLRRQSGQVQGPAQVSTGVQPQPQSAPSGGSGSLLDDILGGGGSAN